MAEDANSNAIIENAADQMEAIMHGDGSMNDIQAIEATMGASSSDERITAEKFERLSTGMTYQDAAKVLGSPGEKSASTQGPGVIIWIYTWKNADGSNLIATFENDGLTSKAQTGLP